jgi:hypothetical protein
MRRIDRFKMWAGFDSTRRRFGQVVLRGPKRLLDQCSFHDLMSPPGTRLAAGVLYIPEQLRFKETAEIEDDPFLQQLMEHLTTPLDPNSPNRSCIQPARADTKVPPGCTGWLAAGALTHSSSLGRDMCPIHGDLPPVVNPGPADRP